ncbi:MAG: glutaminyl-peptide cyclotransferase [Pseudomonadales bacterium]|nr:glutaminyl-peptide cyclotransferase [Pseudomonadales bacterium]
MRDSWRWPGHLYLFLAAVLVLGSGSLFPVRAQTDSGVTIYDIEVVNTYPHNTGSFTQGLLFHDGYLYEGTGQYGRSMLARIRLEDGEVLQSKRLNRRYFGEGIAVVDKRIYQLTWRSNLVLVHDLDSFETITSHYNPTEGWGLTYDGEHLILSDGSARLRFIDPETFVTVRSIDVNLAGEAVRNLNELEYIDGQIWANIWMNNEIVQIDPDSGSVTGIIDLAPLPAMTETGGNDAVLNGIAWDEQHRRLLVTGKLWAHLFEINLSPRQ